MAAFFNGLTRQRFHVPTFILALLAAASVVVHWIGIVQAAPLGSLVYTERAIDIVALSAATPTAPVRLLAAFSLLALLNGAGWQAARRSRGAAAWAIVVGGGLLMAAAQCMLYPLDAADIFDNIMHGRILGVYGENPFTAVARRFANDPFYAYVAWPDSPSAYGPAWEAPAALTARWAGDSLLVNILAFKLLPGLFWLGALGVTAWLLHCHAPHHALGGVLLLAWNPVILFETFGNGHNDIALAFWVIAAVSMVASTRYALAVYALTLGALVKFIPVLLIPAVLVVAWQNLPNRQARVRFLAAAIGGSLALCAFFYWPVWEGVRVLGMDRRAYYLTTSLPAMFYYGLFEPMLGNQTARWVVSSSAALLTVGFTAWQTGRLRRLDGWSHFAQAALSIFLFYLLISCLWFQPWYAVWVLALAPLVPTSRVARLAFLFGFAALAKTLIWVPLWTMPPVPSKVWRELRLGPATMLPAWLYGLSILWSLRRSASAGARRAKTQGERRTAARGQTSGV